MPHIVAIPAGLPIADIAARRILGVTGGTDRARAVVLVPTRRAAVTMRQALQRVLGEETSLLPRLVPLADIDDTLLNLLGPLALEKLRAVPPAMPEWRLRYVLTAQVAAFLRSQGRVETLDYALALAEELMALQEQCARAGVTLSREKLRMLVTGSMAEHWEASLAFLTILAEHWPAYEREEGLTTPANHERLVLQTLAESWAESPPDYPIFAVGSTASQESTAQLLAVVAGLPRGEVMLPGLDPDRSLAEWASIVPGHPLYHVKHFLDWVGLSPAEISSLAPAPEGPWLTALDSTEAIPEWKHVKPVDYSSIHLIQCSQNEHEGRVITLLLREALEFPEKRTALITPDEGLMARVAAQMKRYGVAIDRLERGTLATTDSGSLWVALVVALREPERLIPLRALLHHPLFAVDSYFLSLLEPSWYGVQARRSGQLPALPESVRAHDAYPVLESLVRGLARLGNETLPASEWIAAIRNLLAPFTPIEGIAAETVSEALETLAEADMLGPVGVREFAHLLEERFAQPVRHGGIAAHPQMAMLTPVEARLQQFDRVILAGMTEDQWPGLTPANAWLNLAAQEALGLPSPAHRVSLMAHDLLMLGSGTELFLTWPQKVEGSPTTRSRFIERLVTLLAMQGVPESAITANHYAAWADALDAAEAFTPSEPIAPRPAESERPDRLPVSALDTLFSDPFAIYAKFVLRLRELDGMDAEPEPSDFGNLAHKAIQALTQHWNLQGRSASPAEIDALADQALRQFADRPSTALFWRTRLIRALVFVDSVEAARRTEDVALSVRSEVVVESPIAGITLHGRIDRLEEGSAGLTIADYKTGETPSRKRITDGYATQLLAYAMLVDREAGGTAETAVAGIDYWRLPHGNHEGVITHVTRDELLAGGLPEKLADALLQMRDSATPFLANPGRLGHEYDGISRHDEWAG